MKKAVFLSISTAEQCMLYSLCAYRISKCIFSGPRLCHIHHFCVVIFHCFTVLSRYSKKLESKMVFLPSWSPFPVAVLLAAFHFLF